MSQFFIKNLMRHRHEKQNLDDTFRPAGRGTDLQPIFPPLHKQWSNPEPPRTPEHAGGGRESLKILSVQHAQTASEAPEVTRLAQLSYHRTEHWKVLVRSQQ